MHTGLAKRKEVRARTKGRSFRRAGFRLKMPPRKGETELRRWRSMPAALGDRLTILTGQPNQPNGRSSHPPNATSRNRIMVPGDGPRPSDSLGAAKAAPGLAAP